MSSEIYLYSYPSKFSKNKIKVLIYYPNIYYLGMSNLGFLTIFHKLKENEEIYCERGFYPDIKSFETKTSITEFDIIIFSVSFELDFINILEILIKSGIELNVNKREKPFIAAGGIAITLNPFFFRKIFNVQFIGEGEELINNFLNAYINKKIYSDIDGIFFKDNKNPIRVVYDGKYIAHNVILTSDTEFSNTFLVEIARGCPFKCKFCAVSYNYNPFRIRKKDNILNLFDKFKRFFKKIGLISSSVLSHPDFLEIGDYILKSGKNFSVSSMRLDNINDEKIRILKKAGNTTFTVAIEAGTDRLRKIINKKLSNEQIFKAIDLFIKNKILNLKFYFMIGLPGEEWSDIEEIVNLMSEIKREYLKNKRYLKHLGKFTVSINPFIPKRNTPFENEKIEKLENLKKKIDFLKIKLNKIPNVNVKAENVYQSFLQYYLSNYDEILIPYFIEKINKKISNKKFIDKINEIYY